MSKISNNDIINIFKKSIDNQSFIKATLSKNVGQDVTLKNIYLRLVSIKGEQKISFLSRHQTNDITKNYDYAEGIVELEKLIGNQFLNIDIFTTDNDFSILFNKKREPSLVTKKASTLSTTVQAHDKVKNRTFIPSTPVYLHALNIANSNGEILKEGQKKYRQIDKYIEIVATTLQNHPLSSSPHIVDMGAGKGYLTFALYDYLKNTQQQNITMTGIELRQNLVDFCNDLSKKAKFEQLSFLAQDIFDYQPARIDMLIALHACDIATDIAIAKGIKANAEVIVVAPCCHKQVRNAMMTVPAMSPITKHGIMEERQAELLTDALRALFMEANGYQVKALEFVSIEHTPKNMMLIGVKKKTNPQALQQIKVIKETFGITEHYLEKLLA